MQKVSHKQITLETELLYFISIVVNFDVRRVSTMHALIRYCEISATLVCTPIYQYLLSLMLITLSLSRLLLTLLVTQSPLFLSLSSSLLALNLGL